MNKFSLFFKNLFAREKGKKKDNIVFISSLISIGIGLVIGLVVMILISFFTEGMTIGDAFSGFMYLIIGPFANLFARNTFNLPTGEFLLKVFSNFLTSIGDTIFYAVPLIMTGLSVAIAYKTGLFNIGAPGQYIMGTIGCLLVALSIPTPNRFLGILVWLLAFIVGALLGALWGMIPGLLKAFFNINEVIICIMTNWIAANLSTWIFLNKPGLINQENTKSAFLITATSVGNYTPKLGLDKIFKGSYIDIGIILAIIIAFIVYIILNKTTFGYELKACGSNREASKYAGLNEKKNIILSMVIAGALAGMGACFYYLNSIEFKYVSQYSSLPAYGFNGIASAFLANCSPTGIIVSSVFIRWLNTGGDFLTKCGLNRYIADIVIAIIIYLASITNIVREIIVKYRKKKSQDKEVSKVDGTVIEKEIKPDTLVIEDGAETIKEEEPKVEEVAKDE